MAEVTEQGYVSLRTFIVKEWNHFILLDGNDEKVYSTQLSEVNWIHERENENVMLGRDEQNRPVYDELPYESNQTLEFEVVINGSDLDSLPVTVSSSTISESYSLHERETRENYFREVSKETFDAFTFENANDQLTIKHKIQVPVVG